MFICPAIAAVIVARRRGALSNLGNRLLWPTWSWWWLPAIAVMPLVILLSSLSTGFGALEFAGWLSPIVLGAVYLVSAFGEEVGWTGFALPRLLRLFGELPSALLLGLVWSLWHVIPYWEAGNSACWIFGQCAFTIIFRVVLVRLTMLIGRTIWPAVVAHAAYNFCWSFSRDAGSHYIPWVVAVFTSAAAALLFLGRPSQRGRRQFAARPLQR
jgi:membrane protease YdiL (CAAX protease family)